MSATNRGSDIIDQEFYPTPKYTVNSIMQHIDFSKVQSFTEPCKGEGAIYNLVNVPTKHYCELSEGLDYLTTPMPLVDLVLTNPPFSLAQEFITKARTESTTVIMLQRVNFLGSQARKDFWEKNPPTHLFVLANRPKFIAKCSNKKLDDNKNRLCTDKNSYQITNPPHSCISCGTSVTPASDATEYAWFCWDSKNIITKPNGIYVI